MTIWKWTLEELYNVIEMPKGAKVLAVQVQHEKPQLWACVDPSAPVEKRAFSVRGTGIDVQGPLGTYVGTFQRGWFVGHVFEVV